MLKKSYFFFFILMMTYSQEELKKKLEKRIRDFLIAIEQKDKKKIEQFCIYDKELHLLWTSDIISKNEPIIIQQIKEAPIEWLKEGEEIRLLSSVLRINNTMVNKNRKIALLKITRYAGPIQLIKMNKEWKILPYWVLLNEKLRIEKQQIIKLSSHILEINGIVYNINLNKNKNIQLADGKIVNALLKSNPKIRLNWGIMNLIYPQEYKVRKYKQDGVHSLILRRNNGNRIVIESYDLDKELSAKILLEDTINKYLDDYEKAKFRLLKNSPKQISEYILGKQCKGVRLYIQINKTSIKVETFFTTIYKNKMLFFSYHCFLEQINNIYKDFSLIKDSFSFLSEKKLGSIPSNQ